MKKMNYKISIITVSYNAVKTIEQTIISVINQSYSNLEYIIIDGGSSDGTIDILEKYTNNISYWVSEPDKGIYDAMNKGIDVASGDYIQFLGADDCLVAETTIHDIVQELLRSPDCPLLSAPIWIVDEEMKLQSFYNNNLSKEEILKGYMIPHPGMFVRIDIMKKYKFNIMNRIISDYEFLLKYMMDGGCIIFSTNPTVFFSNRGESSSNENLYLEYKNLMKKYQLPANSTFARSIKKRAIMLVLIKKIIKSLLVFLQIWKRIQKKRGWKNHHCYWKKCRWCGRE